VAAGTGDVWLEYGTQSGSYPLMSAHVSLQAGVPANLELPGLQADTRYVYRVRTAADSGSGVEPPAEHAFRTQRSRGSIFSFTVDADPPWGEINFDSSVYASSGYLRIRVSPSQATVEYVKVYAPGLGAGMQTGTVATSYTLAPRP
jgi:hypothetical protein